jgi:LytR cell envelope-related transcriptional attenuator
VDHPLPPPDALVRPWRTATLLACSVAALELVLLIVLGGALIAKEAAAPDRPRANAARHAAPAQATATTNSTRRVVPPAPAAKLNRSKLRVLVLNGNGRHGAAGAAADRLRHRGYRIGGVTNAQRMDYARSLVMYRRGFAGEGARLARDLRVAVVGPLDGMRPAQLRGAQLVLIVGSG